MKADIEELEALRDTYISKNTEQVGLEHRHLSLEHLHLSLEHLHLSLEHLHLS